MKNDQVIKLYIMNIHDSRNVAECSNQRGTLAFNDNILYSDKMPIAVKLGDNNTIVVSDFSPSKSTSKHINLLLKLLKGCKFDVVIDDLGDYIDN